MRIKFTEGQTLLTLAQIVIVFLVCLALGNITALADNVVNFLKEDEGVQQDGSSPSRKLVVLYYYEKSADGSSGTYIYQKLYLVGSGNQVGLEDAGGNVLLAKEYQDIRALPHAYIVKQNEKWSFIDSTSLEPLSEHLWDSVSLDLSAEAEIQSSLVTVKKDGLFGAVNHAGEIVISPQYDSFKTNSDALWQLITVQKDGLYGLINYSGEEIVPLRYDYLVLTSVVTYSDENDSVGHEIPIIYVCLDGEWGAIYKEGNGASAVDWQVSPTEEVLAAYSTIL